jgi:hypothetical protein
MAIAKERGQKKIKRLISNEVTEARFNLNKIREQLLIHGVV